MLIVHQATEAAVTAVDWALSPLVGISQIFVVENAVSGALILGGIAVYSKEAATHTYTHIHTHTHSHSHIHTHREINSMH